MKTRTLLSNALCLTALTTATACGGGQPDAQAPDQEGVAEEAVDEMEDSIEDVDEQVDEQKQELEEESGEAEG